MVSGTFHLSDIRGHVTYKVDVFVIPYLSFNNVVSKTKGSQTSILCTYMPEKWKNVRKYFFISCNIYLTILEDTNFAIKFM